FQDNPACALQSSRASCASAQASNHHRSGRIAPPDCHFHPAGPLADCQIGIDFPSVAGLMTAANLKADLLVVVLPMTVDHFADLVGKCHPDVAGCPGAPTA